MFYIAAKLINTFLYFHWQIIFAWRIWLWMWMHVRFRKWIHIHWSLNCFNLLSNIKSFFRRIGINRIIGFGCTKLKLRNVLVLWMLMQVIYFLLLIKFQLFFVRLLLWLNEFLQMLYITVLLVLLLLLRMLLLSSLMPMLLHLLLWLHHMRMSFLL